MRVMHVTFDMRIGGTEMVIKNIIEGNADASIEMSIYCIEAPLGPWGEDLKASGTPITVEKRQPGFDKSLISKIRRHIKDNNIDILHCHQYTPWVYGALAAAFTKTKVIFTEHGRFYPDSGSWKRKLVNPVLLKMTDSITAISQATKHALSMYESIPNKSIDLIYNGISPLKPKVPKLEIKTKYCIPNNSFVLGTIARLDPIKNQIMMLRAFSRVVARIDNLFLVIIGDGEMRESLEEEARELGIIEHVLFTGYIPKPDALLNVFDVFLLPSLSEGTSMTLLEAMSLGKPCVVTDAGGNAEIVEHQKTGLVSRNDDVDDYEKALIRIISNSEELAIYSNNAFERFDTLFDSRIMSDKYSLLYQKVVG